MVLSCNKKAEVSPSPVITSLSDTLGVAGSAVTIIGSNFSTKPSDNIVSFNGVTVLKGEITVVSPTELHVKVPPYASSGHVQVAVNNNVAKGPFYVVRDLLPSTISSLSSTSGSLGLMVTITGTNFSSKIADNQVKFNGVVAKNISSSPTEIKVIVPPGNTTGNVVVEVNGIAGAKGPTFTTDNSMLTNTKLYWTSASYGGQTQYIFQSKGDGTTTTTDRATIFTLNSPFYDISGSADIDLYNGDFYISQTVPVVSKLNAGGGGTLQNLYSSTNPSSQKQVFSLSSIAVDPGKALYIIDQGQIIKGGFTGANLVILNNSFNYSFTSISNLAISGTKYFVTDNVYSSSAHIISANLDGSGTPVAVYDVDNGDISDMKIVGNKIYWFQWIFGPDYIPVGTIKSGTISGGSITNVQSLYTDNANFKFTRNTKIAVVQKGAETQLFWTTATETENRAYDVWGVRLLPGYYPVKLYSNGQLKTGTEATIDYNIGNIIAF